MRALSLLIALLLAPLALAQQSKRFEPFEVHYSVVSTTFLSPQVAGSYGIVRGRDRAILNLAVREHLADGTTRARSAKLQGRTWDLFQNQFLEFQEIREGEAIYYIGEFEFSEGELRFFNVDILPEGAERSSKLNFKQKVYDR